MADDVAHVVRAAGIMFVAESQVLFLKRGPGGDHSGEWCFPGGHQEDGETAEEAACRESVEEIGFLPDGDRAVWSRNISRMPPIIDAQSAESAPAIVPDQPDLSAPAMAPGEAIDFTTYLQRVSERFDPILNGEHTGFAWARPDEPPEPLHPGARIALAKLTMDELGIARAMVDGSLTSPQRYRNISLFALRITGTGVSYRSAHDEVVVRPPEIYLNDEFLARCNGLTVIIEHPDKKAVLDTKEFRERSIGSIMLPYLKGDEVWGIAKIFDEAAIQLMEDEQLSTSPSVLIRPAEGMTLTTESGATLLIEGRPWLLDHLAIVPNGVWDKGGPPTGVLNDNLDSRNDSMTEEELKAKADADKVEAEEKARKDAEAGSKLDKLLSCMDALTSKVDSVSGRMDAFETAKKDADGDKPGDPEQVAADKARKDAEEAAEKAKADAEEKGRQDSETKTLKERMDALDARTTERSDGDYAAMADAQGRCDSVAQAFGKSAAKPLSGELTLAYRRRLVTPFKEHSPNWKAVELATLGEDVFSVAETQIYADAMQVARAPSTVEPGTLRAVSGKSDSGHIIREYIGEPGSWMSNLAGPVTQKVSGFRQRDGSFTSNIRSVH